MCRTTVSVSLLLFVGAALLGTPGVSQAQHGGHAGGFDTTSKGFSKKDNKGNKIFWIAAAVVGLVIVALLFYALLMAGNK